MDIKTRIETAKGKLKRAETAKITMETQKQAADKQKTGIEAEMVEEKVAPDTIQAEMVKLEGEIVADLDKTEKLIPEV